MKTKLFLLHQIEFFIGFKMIYWTTMSGSYFLDGSILEKCGNFWKNVCFSGRIWPDWGNTAWADMAGLGSIGLRLEREGGQWICLSCRCLLLNLTFLNIYRHTLHQIKAKYHIYLMIVKEMKY